MICCVRWESNQTDAFALAIVLIELLICDWHDRKISFSLAARGLVDEYDSGEGRADKLAAATKQTQKATEANPSIWGSSSEAKRAARVLTAARPSAPPRSSLTLPAHAHE